MTSRNNRSSSFHPLHRPLSVPNPNHNNSNNSNNAMAAPVVVDTCTSDALRICEQIQLMIEVNTAHLERARSSKGGKTNSISELDKQEIRTLEGKLIKLFSRLIATRSNVQNQSPNSVSAIQKYPSLSQWLRVVGVTEESRKLLESRINSLDHLREKTDSEIHRLLLTASSRLSIVQKNEDLRRLSRAMQNLRKYSDNISFMESTSHSMSSGDLMDLHWDSWNHSMPFSSSASSMTISHPATSTSADLVSSLSSSSSISSAPMPVISSHDCHHNNMMTKTPHKPDSVASSPSSNSSMTSSLPPPSPGLTLSPPVMPWGPERKGTPPSTPPWSAAAIFGAKHQSQKFPTTPPPNKKHSTTFLSSNSSTLSTTSNSNPPPSSAASGSSSHMIMSNNGNNSNLNNKFDYPLTKSKSQECELGNRIYPFPSSLSGISSIASASCIENLTINEEDSNNKEQTIGQSARRKRFPTDSGPCFQDEGIDSGPSPLPSPSPFDSSLGDSASSSSSSLLVPKSPRTPRSMGHAIRHRFKKTLKPGRCDHCSEYLFNGLKCKECKFKCHKDCEAKVPPSCCLPEELVGYYVKQMNKEGSPILPHMRTIPVAYGGGPGADPAISRFGTTQSLHNPPYPDSSSNTSSCNSSTPSSPAVVVTSTQPTPPHSASIYNKGNKFTFPDTPMVSIANYREREQLPMHPPQRVTGPNPKIDSVKSYDSDKTLSGSSGSQGTACRLDSQDSTASVDDSSGTWNAGRQTSISLREWDIPYEELIIGDKIGAGRFSTVHQGNWHGDVAIKILNMENTDDDATLEAFRLDVGTFRKTRHENLILFMGACMNPPKLAIVTSLCKGYTLYTLLHLRKDKFTLNKVIIIAQQIAQGMGYLHHRGIVHKDLKTKNIFLENGHAIIADFGLVNVARRLCAHPVAGGTGSDSLYQRESMSIPKGWLCYLAPEIMRALRVRPDEGEDLPFTKASDIFAFGTVWYELLTGEWPWKHIPPETIIWLVGKGMEPSLANLQASKDVKDILLMCWTYKPEHRPDFTFLSDMVDNIPKKRGLIRSPSHPVGSLWRSAESVF